MIVTFETVLLMSWIATFATVIIAYVKIPNGTFAPLVFIFPFLLTLAYMN